MHQASNWRTVRLANEIKELREPRIRHKAVAHIIYTYGWYDALSGDWCHTQANRSWKRHRRNQYKV